MLEDPVGGGGMLCDDRPPWEDAACDEAWCDEPPPWDEAWCDELPAPCDEACIEDAPPEGTGGPGTREPLLTVLLNSLPTPRDIPTGWDSKSESSAVADGGRSAPEAVWLRAGIDLNV